MHHRECPLKKYTGCWCCGGQHYQKDCPRAGIQRELEKARRYSKELHAELFYNQGGAIRISKLTTKERYTKTTTNSSARIFSKRTI